MAEVRTPPAFDLPATIGAAMDHVIHQFVDPLTCVRELVQNGIDAAARYIDVALRWEPAPAGSSLPGRVRLAVHDFGDGMDEFIIDNYLLVLFKSSKEDDLTKAGKFGIGFLSVFAFKPDWVTVDTGRDGIFWRLVFTPDLAYKKYRRDEPCDGTTVELVRALDPADFDALAVGVEAVLRRFCRYAPATLRLTVEQPGAARREIAINQTFTLHLAAEQRVRDGLVNAVIGYSPEPAPPFGFFHRGITLSEGKREWIPGVAFLLDSPWLKPNLSRSDVVADDKFHEALTWLKTQAEGPLRDHVAARLRDAARDDALGAAFERVFEVAVGPAARLHETRADLRCLPRTDGSLGTFRELLAARDDIVFCDERPTAVSRALAEQGITVWRARAAGAWADFIRAHSLVPRRASTSFAVPHTPRKLGALGDTLGEALQNAASALLQAATGRLTVFYDADFDYDGSAIAGRVMLPLVYDGALEPLGAAPAVLPARVAVNRIHPHWLRLRALAGGDLALAAHLVARLVLAHLTQSAPARQALVHAAGAARHDATGSA